MFVERNIKMADAASWLKVNREKLNAMVKSLERNGTWSFEAVGTGKYRPLSIVDIVVLYFRINGHLRPRDAVGVYEKVMAPAMNCKSISDLKTFVFVSFPFLGTKEFDVAFGDGVGDVSIPFGIVSPYRDLFVHCAAYFEHQAIRKI